MSSGLETRVLVPGDERDLLDFLARHPDSTLFLRSNLAQAGIEDRGEPFQGTYAAAYEAGRIAGVASHYWLGTIVVEAPAGLEAAVRAAVAASGRGVKGFLGRWEQVVAARHALGLDGAEVATASREGLFSLDLARLQVPGLLEETGVVCRPPRDDELDLLTTWRVAYAREALGAADDEATRAESRDGIVLLQREGRQWLLEVAGRPVAYSAFNAALPDCVQVGGVWTPPEHRGRGYGRAVVAATLLEARDRGVARSVLFTDNPFAERAYRALGYEQVGEYGIVLFAGEPRPR